MAVETAYDREASTSYDDKRFRTPDGKYFDRLEQRQLTRALERLPRPAIVLEAGCGTGRFVRAVLAAGHIAYALDPSAHMLGLARSRNQDVGSPAWVLGEGASLPFHSKSVDLVYSIRVLYQHIEGKDIKHKR